MVNLGILLLCSVLSLFFYFNSGGGSSIVFFMGGFVAVYCIKYLKNKIDNFNAIPYTLLVIGGVSALLFLEESNKLNVLVVTLVFTLIALGNDIFGLLKINALKVLGEISYSIYLLHGIVLYVMIDLVLGRDFVKELTVLEYWLMIFGLTPILVIICTLTFKYIEKPFINKGKK